MGNGILCSGVGKEIFNDCIIFIQKKSVAHEKVIKFPILSIHRCYIGPNLVKIIGLFVLWFTSAPYMQDKLGQHAT